MTKKFFFFFFFFFLIFNPYLLLSVFRCHLNARRTSIEHRMEAKKWATEYKAKQEYWFKIDTL